MYKCDDLGKGSMTTWFKSRFLIMSFMGIATCLACCIGNPSGVSSIWSTSFTLNSVTQSFYSLLCLWMSLCPTKQKSVWSIILRCSFSVLHAKTITLWHISSSKLTCSPDFYLSSFVIRFLILYTLYRTFLVNFSFASRSCSSSSSYFCDMTEPPIEVATLSFKTTAPILTNSFWKR